MCTRPKRPYRAHSRPIQPFQCCGQCFDGQNTRASDIGFELIRTHRHLEDLDRPGRGDPAKQHVVVSRCAAPPAWPDRCRPSASPQPNRGRTRVSAMRSRRVASWRRARGRGHSSTASPSPPPRDRRGAQRRLVAAPRPGACQRGLRGLRSGSRPGTARRHSPTVPPRAVRRPEFLVHAGPAPRASCRRRPSGAPRPKPAAWTGAARPSRSR